MSDSVKVVSRFMVILFFIAAGLGVFGFMTHNHLKTAEARLTTIEQERNTLKDKLVSSERSAVQNASATKSCMAEVDTYKSRAQTAEAALESMKSKKAPSRS
jgi:hypothetical protein